MKKQILTTICTLLIPVPWTILLLRTNAWALESPVAEILIFSYAVLMILCGIFAFYCFAKEKIKSLWMQICLVIHGIYAVAGAAAICLMLV